MGLTLSQNCTSNTLLTNLSWDNQTRSCHASDQQSLLSGCSMDPSYPAPPKTNYFHLVNLNGCLWSYHIFDLCVVNTMEGRLLNEFLSVEKTLINPWHIPDAFVTRTELVNDILRKVTSTALSNSSTSCVAFLAQPSWCAFKSTKTYQPLISTTLSTRALSTNSTKPCSLSPKSSTALAVISAKVGSLFVSLSTSSLKLICFLR